MMKAAKDKDRALANGTLQEVDVDMYDDGMPRATEDAPEDFSGSKVVVIHPGSRNLRIGLASDALPKTIPMVIARKWPQSEFELDGGEPRPKRSVSDENESDEQEPLFDKDVSAARSS
jgi:actin-related protein 8